MSLKPAASMKIEGACHCGEIRFVAEVDPDKVRICHCSDCQTMSGSAFRTIVPPIENTFQLLSGKPKIYVKTAEDGAKRAQAFCGTCGTPIYAGPVDATSDHIGIRVGAIKQRQQLIPKQQKWYRSALPWTQDISTITKTDN